MRVHTLLLTIALLLLSFPNFCFAAKDKKDDKGLEALLDMLGEMIGMAGDSVSGDSDISEVSVDGDDNEVTRIDSLVININIGDVEISKTGGDGWRDLGGRFREMFGKHGSEGGHGLFNRRGSGRGEEHGEERGHGREFMPDVAPPPMYSPGTGFMPHPPMQMMEGITPHPEHGMGHPGGPEGMERMHQRMELFSRIPPEVDAGFIEFIMHVGELAWKHPEFRERLEQMVMRMDNAGQDDGRKH